jgi:hypothetical protein
MKQRRAKRRKTIRQPPGRLPPRPTDKAPPLDWFTPLAEPTPIRRANPAMSGAVGPISPLGEPADQANFKGEGGFRADTTMVRAARHAAMLSWIAALERLLAELSKHKKLITELPKLPIGIGHNRPPITNEDIKEIRQAVAVLKAQPVVPTASDELRAAGSTLMRFGEELGTYLLKQADVFVSEAVKSAGKEFGKRLVQSPFWWALATALLLAANSVASWLH